MVVLVLNHICQEQEIWNMQNTEARKPRYLLVQQPISSLETPRNFKPNMLFAQDDNKESNSENENRVAPSQKLAPLVVNLFNPQPHLRVKTCPRQ